MHVSNAVVQQAQSQANNFVSLGERPIKGKGNMLTHLYKVDELLYCQCAAWCSVHWCRDVSSMDYTTSRHVVLPHMMFVL